MCPAREHACRARPGRGRGRGCISIELPRWTSEAVCAHKLRYAMTNCIAIDIDTGTTDSSVWRELDA